MPYYYSWTKSRTLKKKLKGLSKKEIKGKCLERDTLMKNSAKRNNTYIECKCELSNNIHDLALTYPQHLLGFF